jgi:thiosulfate/3-mercaptopyruvate sulfurtransferase
MVILICICLLVVTTQGESMPWLINTAQLDKFRKNPKNVIIFDATWHVAKERDAKQEYLNAHIAGAHFFDLNTFYDADNFLPNMLIRDENRISELMGKLGVTPDYKIIFYDNSDEHTSCRALWMLKVFGHLPNHLYILDGGMKSWEKYGGKIETGQARIVPRTYPVNFQAQYIRTLIQMKTNLHHPSEQVIDVRHPIRYIGGTEPRPGLRSGHIPGSYSFPYMTMFEKDGQWKPLEKIRKQLLSLGVELNAPIVTTCGSGMTAAILNFVLDLFGQEQHALYDGSWSEWGAECLYAGESSLEERPVKTSLET